MRTIKFKGKCLSPKNGKEIACGSLLTSYDGSAQIIEEGRLGFFRFFDVDPTTVCQFTGLKDKNGEEVWEHDILASKYAKGEVVFLNGCFYIKREESLSFPFSALFVIDGKIDDWGVVGVSNRILKK